MISNEERNLFCWGIRIVDHAGKQRPEKISPPVGRQNDIVCLLEMTAAQAPSK